MQIQLSLPLNGIRVSVSLFCFVLSYSSVQFQDLGRNINHSHLILVWFGYSIALRLVQNCKPKLVRHMAKSLKYDNENGKCCIWPRFLCVSSMLFVLGALCLSKHICINAGPTSLPLLCPVLHPVPPSTGSSIIMLLMEELIKPSRLVFHLTTLSQRLGSCVSVVYTTVWFLSKCLEHFFISFIDLDFKPLLCFEECINQRDWHQQAFHWVLKKREPLKIARLFCNKLL